MYRRNDVFNRAYVLLLQVALKLLAGYLTRLEITSRTGWLGVKD